MLIKGTGWSEADFHCFNVSTEGEYQNLRYQITRNSFHGEEILFLAKINGFINLKNT